MCSQGFEFKFKLFANKSFTENILNPIVEISSSVSDTAELFMRAFQLSNLCEKNINKKQYLKEEKTNVTARYNEFKIGATVQNKLNYLFAKNYLSEEEILNLKNEAYCKKVFNLSFPLLRNKNESRYDKNGHPRYYSPVFGEKYYVCNHWYEHQRLKFESWYNSIIEKGSTIKK